MPIEQPQAIRTIFFDVGFTLLYPYPSLPEVCHQVCQNLHLHVHIDAVRDRMYDAEDYFLRQQRLSRPWASQTAITEFWIGYYMSTAHQVFGTDSDGGYNSFMWLVTSELGSEEHPDRLTVFLDRPNGHKGRMFGGAQPVSATTFGNKAAGDEQLLVARELGMVFSYMNNNVVWGAFCASYNAILQDMQTFDNWINNQQPPGSYIGAPSNMADEWPKYVRSELDNVVNLGRSGWRNMNTWKVKIGRAHV